MSENIQQSEVDIDKQQLGSVYANALLGACEKQQNSQQILDELDSLVDDLLKRIPALEATLASPRVTAAEKSALLDRVFGDRMSNELLTFLKVVGNHGRLDCIRQIRRAAREEFDRRRGNVEVRVTSAAPLDDQLQQQTAAKLRSMLGRDVHLRCDVDPDIIGGLIVRVGDTVYDGSVANKLNSLRGETISKTFQQLRDSVDRFATTV